MSSRGRARHMRQFDRGQRAAGTGRANGIRSVRVRALLCLGLLGGLAATTSSAYWTDDVGITGTTLTAGVLDLTVNDADPFTAATALSMSAMVPGSTSAQVLTVKNAGTAPLTYTLSGGLSGANAVQFAAASALRLTVVLDGTKSGSGATSTCTGGTVIHGPTPLTTSGTTLILSRRPAAALAPAATESLCVQLTLDVAAPSTLQGLTTNVAFTATGSSDVS